MNKVWVLILFLIATMSIHLLTASYSPVHWMDEVQIADIAWNGVSEKSSPSSLCMISEDGTPNKMSWAIYYVGGVVHEASYCLMGHAGPRYVNILLLAMLSLAVFYYAKKKTDDSTSALILAALFSCLPALVRSVRGGRVDVLALLFVVLSLCVVNFKSANRKIEALGYVVAGSLVVLGFFSWISSLMLVPVVLCEMIDIQVQKGHSWRDVLKFLVLAAIGASIASVVLLLPFTLNFRETIIQFTIILSSNTNDSGSGINRTIQFAPFLKEILFVPAFIGFGVALLFFRKRAWIAALGVVVFALTCLATRVYIYRMLYFSIYALIGVVYFIRDASAKPRKVVVAILGCMFCVSLFASVIVRNVMELPTRNVRDYEKVKNILADRLGVGSSVVVYMDAFELAYVGRDLGWTLYRTANMRRFIPEIVKKADYYIAQSHAVPPELSKELETIGFRALFDIDEQTYSEENVVARLVKRFNRASVLGPYSVYIRKK